MYTLYYLYVDFHNIYLFIFEQSIYEILYFYSHSFQFQKRRTLLRISLDNNISGSIKHLIKFSSPIFFQKPCSLNEKRFLLLVKHFTIDFIFIPCYKESMIKINNSRSFIL